MRLRLENRRRLCRTCVKAVKLGYPSPKLLRNYPMLRPPRQPEHVCAWRNGRLLENHAIRVQHSLFMLKCQCRNEPEAIGEIIAFYGPFGLKVKDGERYHLQIAIRNKFSNDDESAFRHDFPAERIAQQIRSLLITGYMQLHLGRKCLCHPCPSSQWRSIKVSEIAFDQRPADPDDLQQGRKCRSVPSIYLARRQWARAK